MNILNKKYSYNKSTSIKIEVFSYTKKLDTNI